VSILLSAVADGEKSDCASLALCRREGRQLQSQRRLPALHNSPPWRVFGPGRRFDWSAKPQDRPHNPAQIYAGNYYRTDSAQDLVFAQSRTSFPANYCTKMQQNACYTRENVVSIQALNRTEVQREATMNNDENMQLHGSNPCRTAISPEANTATWARTAALIPGRKKAGDKREIDCN
jgi:hypothetical protein